MTTPFPPQKERKSRLKSFMDKLLGRKPKSFKVIRSRKLKPANTPLPEIMEDATHDAALPDPSFTTFASSSTNYTGPSNNQGCRTLLCFTNTPNSSSNNNNNSTSSISDRPPAFYATGPSRSCAALEATLIPTAVQPQTFFLRGVPKQRPQVVFAVAAPESVTSATAPHDNDNDVNELPDDRLTLPSQRRRLAEQPRHIRRTKNMRDMRQAYLDAGA
ncbi:hypothetical protein QBC41DRAFT_366313 [Cercophora samala]|uniref:Uncharacterized protein n=1 Tax=Cercophora samala TaxID=330535 RepID=A0AA40DB10_9PEZI|nr:hypothetical protein QBC41DRAFT_366313 [Cercophora samala]